MTVKEKQFREAFDDHGVNYVEHSTINGGRNAWTDGLRAATVHHTAGKNSLDYLASFNYGGCNALIQHGGYNGHAKDGRAVILCWGSAWHSGAGGPWKGVAARDSLHLVSWGIEIESIGTTDDMTDAQIDTTGRMLAALVDLGMPPDRTHRHADWTDGTGPCEGGPYDTKGRKIDTNKSWYKTSFWRAHQDSYFLRWDKQIPTFEGCMNAYEQGFLNPQAHRIACRLKDWGFYNGEPLPAGEQGYPLRAVQNYQEAKGYDVPVPGQYGPKLHEQLWGVKP